MAQAKDMAMSVVNRLHRKGWWVCGNNDDIYKSSYCTGFGVRMLQVDMLRCGYILDKFWARLLTTKYMREGEVKNDLMCFAFSWYNRAKFMKSIKSSFFLFTPNTTFCVISICSYFEGFDLWWLRSLAAWLLLQRLRSWTLESGKFPWSFLDSPLCDLGQIGWYLWASIL